LTESENSEASSYNTTNLSTTAIGEHNLQDDEETAKHKILRI